MRNFSALILTAGCLSLALLTRVQAIDMEELRLGKNGDFLLDGVSFYVSAYGKDFERTIQPTFHLQPGYPRKGEDPWVTQCTVEMANAKNASIFTQEMRRESDGRLQLHYTVENPAALAIRGYFLEISLPLSVALNKSYRVDSTTQPFPAEYKEAGLYERAHVTDLSFPTETGTVTLRGNFSVRIQDNRLWKSDRYLLRIGFTNISEAPYRSELTIQLGFEPTSH